jgi:ribA/ribD-fused uncharacterized protein
MADLQAFEVVMKRLLDDGLRPVKADIASLTSKIDTFQQSLIDVQNSVEHANNVAGDAKNIATGLEKRVAQLESDLMISQNTHKQLLEQTLRIETQSRRDNLKFDGIPESKGENCLKTLQDVLTKMNIDCANMPIVRVHRIRSYSPKQSSPRTLIVKFVNFADRERVWSKRSSLKGTNMWVCEDFPGEIEKRRKTLWPYFRAARAESGVSNDSNHRNSVSLRIDKLIINSQVYSVNNLESLPSFAKPVKYTSSRTTKDITLFFTKDNPLSNFHPSEFELDGQKFNCVEQYVAYHKALLFGETDIAEDILQTEEPRIQKQKAKDINLKNFCFDEWKSQASDILKPALFAKFSQNEQLKTYLMKTGDSIIAEASPSDCLFGIGLSLNNPKAVDKTLWRGKNIQGTTLMSIRTELA